MKRRSLTRARLAFRLLLLCSLPNAFTAVQAGAAAGPSPRTETYTLDNGLELILREDHRLPVVALCTHVNGGARTETDELHGLSHYYEHTIFRGGTARQGELETRKVLRELGDFSGYTSDDQTTYTLVVPARLLDEAYWRYADALLGLKVTADKIERDRPSILQEYAMRLADSPEGRSWELLLRTAFEKHPYRVSPIGLLDVISSAKLDRFKTFYRERYVPNQMVLAVVGDFDTADMLKRVRETYGARPAGRPSFETGIVEPEQTSFREAHETAKSTLVYGTLGFKTPELSHPDTPVIAVLDQILAGGPSSRLERALRLERPLAQGLWSAPDPRRDPGIWVFGFSCRAEDERPLVETLLGELGRVASGGVSAEEVERAQELLERSHAATTETALGQAVRLADYAVKRALPFEGRWVSDVRAVTAADVERVAKSMLVSTHATLALVRPDSAPAGAGAGAGSYRAEAASLLAAPAVVSNTAHEASSLAVETLDSGLRLAVRADRGTGLASVVAAVRGGQWSEGKTPGAAALLARVLTRGTQALDEKELGQRLDRIGAQITATAEEDLTLVRLSTPSAGFEQALPLFLDVLFRPRLDPEAVEKARKEQLAAVDAIADDSFRETGVAFRKRLYGDLPYAVPVEGERGAIAGISPEALATFHRATYVPSSTVLAAAGDFDPQVLRTVLAERLRDLPPAGSHAMQVPDATVPVTAAVVDEVARPDRSQTTFNLGRLGPGALDPQALALRIAARALGGRLFFRFVYEDAFAYRMWTRYPQLLGPAPFYFEMGVKPADRERALEGVKEEIRRALGTGLPASEIETAKRSLEQSTLLDLQTAAHRAEAYARYEAIGLGADYPERIAERLASLRADDVNRALRQVVDPDRSVLVRMGPSAGPASPAPQASGTKATKGEPSSKAKRKEPKHPSGAGSTADVP